MGNMQLPPDFKDLINSLNGRNVRYLLLGGWAVGLYGFPRATKDIDFIIATDMENLESLEQALIDFGAPPVDMNQFMDPESVFRLGVSPVQVDIITRADGIEFNDCFTRRNIINVDGIQVSVISKQDLVKNKQVSARYQDLADVEKLK